MEAHLSSLQKSNTTESFIKALQEDTDFVIDIGEIKIPCHKRILRKASAYFEALFCSGMKESEHNHVTLVNTDEKIFMCLIKFAYLGELDISEENMFLVSAMSSMYQFEGILQQTEKFLASMVASRTWCEILQFSEWHNLKEAYYAAFRYILWYFPKESKTNIDDFKRLRKDLLCRVLGHPLLNCDTESQALHILIAYCESQGISPSSEEFAELFSAVIYVDDLCFDDIKAINLDCIPQVTRKKGTLKSAQGSVQSSHRSRKGPLAMLCVGGDLFSEESGVIPSKCIYQLDKQTAELKEFARLDDILYCQGTHMGFRACCVDTDLYITGGTANPARTSWLTDVWKFNSFTRSWCNVTSLLQPRRHHGICVLAGEIYLMGGFGKFRRVLMSVEKYNPTSDKWLVLAPMLESEFWPAAVACQGDIYVMKNHIQKYSPETDQWTKLIVDLPVNLGYHSAVSVQDVIYMKCQFDCRLVKLQTGPKHMKANIVAEFSESRKGQLVYYKGKIYCLQVDPNSKSQYYDTETKSVVTMGGQDLTLNRYNVVLFPSFPSEL